MKLALKYVIEIVISKFYNFLSIFPKHIIMIPTNMVLFIPSFENKIGVDFNCKWRARSAPVVYDFWLSGDMTRLKIEKINKKYSNNRYILITHVEIKPQLITFKCLRAF